MPDPGTQQNALLYGKNRATGKMQALPVSDEKQGLVVIVEGQPHWRKLASAQLTASAATVYKAGRNYKDVRLTLTNTDTAQTYYATVYVLTGSESAADSTAVRRGLAIPPGVSKDLHIALSAGDSVQGLADVTLKITMDVEGEDFI